ncbi:DUF4259 domain-containing protein [Motilimonas sp. E26]|uniref:DUF4259 domain-containing protein n=1 Tax=Motilimonas sp. E26 TaxID=2865674 RepID=UPI001E28AED5|nr:DUF4259 domain-containing protein [Motilimonas sp. E26]MCE0559315.1 DUF4259 domain-containing protein [Motilimonas sp. E26]
MGAWGIGNFDNDSAGDWTYELGESSDLTVIENAINAVFEDDYIDSDIGCEALAAIDTLARVKGNFGKKDSYTENVDEWVSKYNFEPPKELIENAVKAAKAILGDQSELSDIWRATEYFDAWRIEVESVIERVGA